MCGRITQTPKLETLVAKYGVRKNRQLDLSPHYNGAPGQDFVAVRNQGGAHVLEELRWGYIPEWAANRPGAKRLINARSETVHQKPSFRSAFQRRRCVIPVSGWFEWRPENGWKQPYWLRPEGTDMFSLAGIWESGGTSPGAVDTFVILTMAAAPAIADIHHRQPVILDPGTVRIEGVRFIGATLWTDLLLEGMADEIGAHMRVGREITDFLGAIQHQGRDFTTGESVERHRADRAVIERELEKAERSGDRVVVITHHAPSPRSIRPWFEGDPFNCAFASDLDRVIDRYQPELWIHGHMHDPVDERLGRTRLLANPAGYRYEAKRGFDPGLCVDLDEAVAGEE